MGKVQIVILMLFTFSFIKGQEKYQDKKGDTHLWGKIELQQLKEEPYKEWYVKALEKFDNPNLEDHIVASLREMEVKIFLGTWCGDSKKWVPKFMELWELSGLDPDKVKIIGLHHVGDNYKQGLNNEENPYNIHRVPTFVFEKNEEEVGRIVERPWTDLSIDVAQIALGVPSKPRYKVASLLFERLEIESLDSLNVNIKKIKDEVDRELTGPGELGSMGFVLKADGQMEEALFVMRLNSLLFPNEAYCFDCLGSIQFTMNDKEAAKESWYKALELDPRDDYAIKKLNELKEEKSE